MSETFLAKQNNLGVCHACYKRTGENTKLVPVFRKFNGGNWYCKDPECIRLVKQEASQYVNKWFNKYGPRGQVH